MARGVVLASVVVTVLGAAVMLVPVASGSSTAKYTVTAVDFGFKGIPARVLPGAYTFTLVNRGEATHNLKLAGKTTPLLNGGGRAVLTVTLKRGTYAFLCTVPGHATLGMKGKLVVR
jgi:plastocyanin